jgi:hypothetical protein
VHFSNGISWQCLGDKIFVINEVTDYATILKGVSAELWLIVSQCEHLVCEIDKLISELAVKFELEVIVSKINDLVEKKLLIGVEHE